jgi:hypothetical protein
MGDREDREDREALLAELETHLPPQGFFRALMLPLRANIKDGPYRFWSWLAAYCWRGEDAEPFTMPTRDQAEVYWGTVMDVNRKSIQNYIRELKQAGLLVAEATSRGYEMYPVGIIPVPHHVSQLPLVVAEGDGKIFPNPNDDVGKNFPNTVESVGKNFPNTRKEGQVGKALKPAYLPEAINSLQVPPQSTPELGKNFPKSRKKSSSPRPAFGKKIPNPPRSTDIPPANPDEDVDKVDESTLDAEELRYYLRLKEISIYGKNALRAVRRALAEGVSDDELMARAQTHIAQCRAEKGVKNVYKLAAWRLATEPLRVPESEKEKFFLEQETLIHKIDQYLSTTTPAQRLLDSLLDMEPHERRELLDLLPADQLEAWHQLPRQEQEDYLILPRKRLLTTG